MRAAARRARAKVPLDEATFRRESDRSLESLQQSLIAAEEGSGFEAEYNNGVLNVLYEDGTSKFVFYLDMSMPLGIVPPTAAMIAPTRSVSSGRTTKSCLSHSVFLLRISVSSADAPARCANAVPA
jgi:hypothetical protein